MAEQKLRQDCKIGQNFKKLRMRAGMTQADVAIQLQLAGIDKSHATYGRMEKGNYGIRISELAALREIFHCSWEDFFQGI